MISVPYFQTAVFLSVAAVSFAQDTQLPPTNGAATRPEPDFPLPSGPQADGLFRKVILDADQQVDGEWKDTVKDPMELAVAADGRVFYAQRDGTIKVWKPKSKKTSTVGKIKVFDGLEDGMLGIALDPNFADNNWIYLNYSLPET